MNGKCISHKRRQTQLGGRLTQILDNYTQQQGKNEIIHVIPFVGNKILYDLLI